MGESACVCCVLRRVRISKERRGESERGNAKHLREAETKTEK